MGTSPSPLSCLSAETTSSPVRPAPTTATGIPHIFIFTSTRRANDSASGQSTTAKSNVTSSSPCGNRVPLATNFQINQSHSITAPRSMAVPHTLRRSRSTGPNP